MRPVTILQAGSVKDPVARSALMEIERASKDYDVTQIANNFVISGTYTQTRTLNVSTATLSDLIAFVATLVSDLQKGGSNRNV